MKEKRENFASRLGFILVSAGCAIGIGNVWKFPYVCGANGGAIFVIIYLVFLAIMGIPVLTMELAIGRSSGRSITSAYRELEKKGSKWHFHGKICIAGCYLLMMYYTTVAGWMLSYFWKFLTGGFEGKGIADVPSVFTEMLSDPIQMIVFMSIIVILGFGVLAFGVKKGLENVNKFMMIGLLLLIVVLAGNSIILDGSSKGIEFYLLPNPHEVEKVGIFNVITAAMNQAFFTLSLGIAAMEIFGSYMSKDHCITGESIKICALDTFVAIMSGLIIFPACFSFGIQPDQGPSLIFVTLPSVFIHMPGGSILGAMFFLFMTFASFSTVIGVFENLVGNLMDDRDISRKKSVLINCIIILVASIPCVLGYNLWSDFHPLPGMNILDTEDFIVSNLLLPLGSLIITVFCVYRFGWGAEKYLAEVNTGNGIKMSRKFIPYFKYVLPLLILVILISGFF